MDRNERRPQIGAGLMRVLAVGVLIWMVIGLGIWWLVR
jgi:hypothetical protein